MHLHIVEIDHDEPHNQDVYRHSATQNILFAIHGQSHLHRRSLQQCHVAASVDVAPASDVPAMCRLRGHVGISHNSCQFMSLKLLHLTLLFNDLFVDRSKVWKLILTNCTFGARGMTRILFEPYSFRGWISLQGIQLQNATHCYWWSHISMFECAHSQAYTYVYVN
jgi:hypothetical protein